MKLITRFPHNYRQSLSLVSQCLQWNVWCTALQTPHAAAVYSTPVTSNTRSTDSCSLVPAYLPAFFFGVTHSSVSESDSGLLGLWWEGTQSLPIHYAHVQCILYIAATILAHAVTTKAASYVLYVLSLLSGGVHNAE